MLITNRLEVFSIFCCCLLIFTFGLYSHEIIGFDSRFYLFALEMRDHGMSWFPTAYQKPYPDYLGTSTALIYLFVKLFGGLNKLVAILPTAISAAITLVFTYLIGALHNKRWGWYAVFFAMMTVMFFQSARSISLDMLSTMITTICFYVVYSAEINGKPVPTSLFCLLLLLGFAFRGPIGLVIPAGVICTYYFLDKNYKKFFILGGLAFTLLAACFAMLLLLAYQTGGHAFLQDVLRMEVLGRINNAYLPRYFYFTNSLSNYSLSLPLMWLVMGGICYYRLTNKYDTPDSTLIIKLFGWVLIILIGMSVPGDKKTRYILPIVPAAALIASYIFIAPENQTYFAYLRKIIRSILLCFPLLFLLLLTSVYWYAKQHAIVFPIAYYLLAVLLAAMQAINFYVYLANLSKKDIFIVVIASLSFILAYIKVIEPIEMYRDKSLAFVQAIETLRSQQHARLAFYKEWSDGLPIKYLINMQKMEYPIFIIHYTELVKFHKNAFFVTSENYFNDLPSEMRSEVKIIAKNKLGHVPVIVFTKQKEW